MRLHRQASVRISGMLVLLVVLAGCSGQVRDGTFGSSISTRPAVNHVPSPASTPTSVNSLGRAPGTTLVAEPSGSTVAIYDSPNGSQPVSVLANPWLLNGVSDQPIPQVLLVLGTSDHGWVKIQLPSRPNGSIGWLRPGAARLLVNHYRIEVTQHLHLIVVLKDGTPIFTGPVAIGAPATPTPVGLFYIRVLLHTTDPGSVYGPYAYGLSAHSEALTTFDGGDAEIGIHGNDDASVLGQSVSHGCIRMDNQEITQLAQILPLGTPVEISA
ncbi:MAG TPA: L,D-transpeptidase family protein [Acidimicrobiales bacterium]